MWIEALGERRNPNRQRFEIRDTRGEVLLVLPFSEIAETGARRPPCSFAALQKNLNRTLSLQAEVKDQIGTARRRLRETQETLARFK